MRTFKIIAGAVLLYAVFLLVLVLAAREALN